METALIFILAKKLLSDTNNLYYIMNKKKYVAPACECIVLNSVAMMATSVYISDQVTGSDAVMSNTNRHDNFGLWNFDW